MKLRYSPRSPFVRKVLVAAIETGQRDAIELVPTRPSDPNTDLPTDNPLNQIPTLITDDGQALYDSAVICEYLDCSHEGLPLFPRKGDARWVALRLQTLGDGITDAGVARTLENTRRPETYRWPEFHAREQAKVRRVLDKIESEVSQLEDPITIASIAIACGLAYLDYRFNEDKWRDGHPKLAAWFGRFSARPAMQETAPPPDAT